MEQVATRLKLVVQDECKPLTFSLPVAVSCIGKFAGTINGASPA